MKRIVTLVAGTLLTASAALMFSSCTKQCACYKVTHYINYSTEQNYTETVDGESHAAASTGNSSTKTRTATRSVWMW